MNLILFTDGDRVEPSKIALRGRRLQHLRQIHRANSGDILRVGEIDGLMGKGLEQSRDTQVPRVHHHHAFKPFVEDSLPGMIRGGDALLAHPGEHSPCPRHISGETLLVIGPEGGFIPYEVDKLQSAGCNVVSLGPRILRVENAVTSLLGRLF